MTSDGPYPPGYEPANDGPPYGRYPGEEPTPDAPPGRTSGSARVNQPGDWSPPSGPDQYGRDQPGGPPAGFGTAPGQPGTPTQYGSVPGQYGGQPEQYGGQPEPYRPPAQPSGPPGGHAAVNAPTGVYGSPPERGQFGGPTQYGAPAPSEPTQYGTPTQYGGGQYGAAPSEPTQYGAPAQAEPTQYGTPTQYGAGQYGAGSQYGTPTQYGAPAQAEPTQYGTPTQYGGGQYGSGQGQGQYDDPDATRFSPGYRDGQGFGGAQGFGGGQGYGDGQNYGGQPGYGDAPAPGGEEPARRSRRGLLIGLVIAGVVVVILIAVAIVAAMRGGGDNDFAVGSCVKQSGDKATSASCSDSGAYSVVNKVDAADKCTDKNQPFVILRRHGYADEVLCLKPAS